MLGAGMGNQNQTNALWKDTEYKLALHFLFFL